MKKTVIFIITLAGILSAFACKKDETTETTPSLSGLIISEAVPYVAKGDVVVFKANVAGLLTSDGTDPGIIGLYWQVNSAKKDTLSRNIKTENPDFEYSVDSLGTYQVSCYAFTDKDHNFYNASAVTSFQAIDPANALTGIGQDATVIIGGKEWTAMNLDSTTYGVSHKGSDVTAPLFGRFFTWEEASAACPSGWHLPTAEEWDALGKDVSGLMAPAKFLDEDMWKAALGQSITNSTGFNAIPVGYLDNTASIDKFRLYGEMAAFWTASDSAQDATQAQFRFIRYDNPEIMKGSGDKTSLALSVRCVKD
ncbi:MAG: fibrobacter succinogenes major paralogous domain-containing protein [Bacteroidales bacterium]|nr:fibrobacter succinogenes major paralogous domain-containing protein [Bacteroidales bacterium]